VGISSLLRANGLSVMFKACLLGGARDILLLVVLLLLTEHCCLLSTGVELAGCGHNRLYSSKDDAVASKQSDPCALAYTESCFVPEHKTRDTTGLNT
jgi:hypothetical protein